MKKSKKILVPALFTGIICTLIASTGMTLAWYSNSLSLEINNLQVKLASDPSLKIGIRNKEGIINFYENEVPEEALSIYHNELFKPVSTMYSSTFIENKEEFPVFRSKYGAPRASETSTYKESNVAVDGYFTIELYLLSDSDVYVTVDKSCYFKGNSAANKIKAEDLKSRYPDLTVEEIATKMDNIDHSLRFSILDASKDSYKYTIIDPYKEEDTYYSGSLDIDANGFYDSYLTSDGKRNEFLFGEYYNDDKIVYSYNKDTKGYSGELSTFNSGHQADSYTIDLDASVNNGLTRVKENSVSLKEASEDDELIALKHDEAKRIVFSIYIEGRDLDNTNVNEYGAFTSFFKFKVSKENL